MIQPTVQPGFEGSYQSSDESSDPPESRSVTAHPRGQGSVFGVASRTLAYGLGGGVVTLAIAMMMTSMSAETILEWLRNTLGVSFLCIVVALVIVSIVSWVNLLRRGPTEDVWLEAGLNAASGIATVALTFTLLGISLGIGSLANQALTPDTVQAVIRDLTAEFSLAFLTSVIGLPLSTLLRAMLLVTHAWSQSNRVDSVEEVMK